MAGTSFAMNFGPIINAIEGMIDKAQKTQELMAAIGEAMVASTLTRFEESVAPDGTSWQANQRGGQTLVDSARLKNSIVWEATLDQVIWGTNVEYGAIHQFGGECGRALSVTLPARPYLGLNAEDRAEIQHMLHSFVMQTLGAV